MLSYPSDFWKTSNGKYGLESRAKISKSVLTEIAENKREQGGKVKEGISLRTLSDY